MKREGTGKWAGGRSGRKGTLLGTAPLGEVESPRGLLERLCAEDQGAVETASKALDGLVFAAGRPGADRERRSLALALAEAAADTGLEPRARAAALEYLAHIGGAESVKALEGILGAEGEVEDLELRDAARRALEANPSPMAKSALRRALRRTKGALRAAVCRSLGIRRDLLAVGPLVGAFYEDDEEVSFAAAEALAEIGDEQSVAVVEAALERFKDSRRAHITGVFLRLANRLAENGERGMARRLYTRAMTMGGAPRAAALIGVARAGLQSEIPKIVAALEDPDPAIRSAAREAAAAFPGQPMAVALEKAFRSAPLRLQVELCEVLARRGDAQAVALLAEALRSESDELRDAAIAALGRTGSAGAADVLLAHIGAPDPLGTRAARALVELEAPGVDEKLEAARREGGPRADRIAAVLERRRRRTLVGPPGA